MQGQWNIIYEVALNVDRRSLIIAIYIRFAEIEMRYWRADKGDVYMGKSGRAFSRGFTVYTQIGVWPDMTYLGASRKPNLAGLVQHPGVCVSVRGGVGGEERWTSTQVVFWGRFRWTVAWRACMPTLPLGWSGRVGLESYRPACTFSYTLGWPCMSVL